MPSANLAYWMGKFVLEVCKKDGKEYPPKTLYALVCCFKGYYEQNGVFDVNPLSSSDARFGTAGFNSDQTAYLLHTAYCILCMPQANIWQQFKISQSVGSVSAMSNVRSAEPGRKAPYSPDICWRVIWQRLGMGLSFREIARNLSIATSTAITTFRRFEETGEEARSSQRENL